MLSPGDSSSRAQRSCKKWPFPIPGFCNWPPRSLSDRHPPEHFPDVETGIGESIYWSYASRIPPFGSRKLSQKVRLLCLKCAKTSLLSRDSEPFGTLSALMRRGRYPPNLD